MALPTSGPLSLANIQTEFGGANPISLSEYYAGGGLVPAGTAGTNGAVPSSGTISIANFYGTTAATVNFTDTSVQQFIGSGTSFVQYQIRNTGYVWITDISTGDPFQYEQWVSPTSAASNYEVFATLSSGSLTTGTTGSWLSLGTDRNWTCRQVGAGVTQASLSMQVRSIGTTTVLDTWTVNLSAEVFT